MKQGIISTPKRPRPYLIREEEHPLKRNTSVFRVYDQQGCPLFLGGETFDEVVHDLKQMQLVSSLMAVFRRDLSPQKPFQMDERECQGTLEAYWQTRSEDEIDRLRAALASLTEDLKMAYGFLSNPDEKKVLRPLLDLLNQEIADAEAILAFSLR